MRNSRFAEHQIVGALKRVESEVPKKDLCRELRISSVAVVKKLKSLEAENRYLKQMVADLSLDHQVSLDMIEKALSTAVRRNLLGFAGVDTFCDGKPTGERPGRLLRGVLRIDPKSSTEQMSCSLCQFH